MQPSNQPLQPPHSAVTRLARTASRAPAGGRLNGGVGRTRGPQRTLGGDCGEK